MKTTPWAAASGIVRITPVDLAVKFETDYRAALIILALEAWKLQHGGLPAGLDLLLERELPACRSTQCRVNALGIFPT